MSSKLRYWAIIPAAGIGIRIRADIPKQYLKINNKSILEYALECFCHHTCIEGVVVAVAEHDSYWPELEISKNEKVMVTVGGKERCNSVLNGLEYLAKYAAADDWIMVHDAVRPCVRKSDIDLLIRELEGHAVGGILALPVRDTMKRADENNEISETVERGDLWHALTPQVFRLNELREALEQLVRQNVIVTDEAQAMERIGLRGKLVQGSSDNIKITHQSDLLQAKLYLLSQGNSGCE